MDVISEITIKALGDLGAPALRVYGAALDEACNRFPPSFGHKSYGEIYRSFAVNPEWMAISLISSAEREGDGASRLWSLAACTPDSKLSELVKQHAIDESRHSRWYVAMLNLVFPDAADETIQVFANGLSPGYTATMPLNAIDGSPFSHPVTLDDLVQMNIAEIRTRVHHLLQRPALLAHCPMSERGRVTEILNRLLHDETRHVLYTAELIEQFALEGEEDAVRTLISERLHDFNEVTDHELKNAVFEST
jgi:hypothetical protein